MSEQETKKKKPLFDPEGMRQALREIVASEHTIAGRIWAKAEREKEEASRRLEQRTAEAAMQLSEETRAMLARLSDAEKCALSLVLNKEVKEIDAKRHAEDSRKDAIDYMWRKVGPVAKRLGVDRRKAREVFLEVMEQRTPALGYWKKDVEPQEWEARFRESGLVPPPAD